MSVCLDQATTAPPRESPRRYSMYGLSVRSDLPLPLAPDQTEDLAGPEVVIRRFASECPIGPDEPPVARISCPIHGTHMREYRRLDGVWIWLREIGAFRVSPDAAYVDVYPDDQADDQALGLALAGPVLTFVRHKLGCPSLHASAVVTADGAVAFLGPRGRGKSTMAASFLRRGALLLTDDALPLLAQETGIDGVPGPAFMKVWHETATHTLGLRDDPPHLMANVEKRLFALHGHSQSAARPARLRALYLLDRYDPLAAGRDDVTMQPLGGREALMSLLIHTAIRPYLLPADQPLLLRIYVQLLGQAPLHVLSYPGGFAYQDAVHARILRHLEEQ